MSTIHGPNNAGLKVNIDVTRQRQTPKTGPGDTPSAGINRTADTVAAASHAGRSVYSRRRCTLGRCKWSWNSSLKSAVQPHLMQAVS